MWYDKNKNAEGNVTEEERLKAYDEMKAWIENEYETLTEKLAALKAAEKTLSLIHI